MTEIYLNIRLYGRLTVTSSAGQDLTPRSKKARGILALLATGDQFCRSREWLQQKLWSTRGADQAKGSLRTDLQNLRIALGAAKGILKTDRNDVWLSRDLVSTDLSSPPEGKEFLEGVGSLDPAFDEWLAQWRGQRQAVQGQILTQSTDKDIVRIQCGPLAMTQGPQGALEKAIDDQVGKYLSEFIIGGQRVARGNSSVLPDLVVQSSVERSDSGTALFIQVIDPVTDRLIHTALTSFTDLSQFLNQPDQFAKFCWNAADWAMEEMPSVLGRDSLLGHRTEFVQAAFRETLSFDGARMQAALTNVQLAQSERSDGVFLALQAWIMMSMILEEFMPENADSLGEIRVLIERAEALSPTNPLVSAISANLRAMLFEEFDAAFASAQRSLRGNQNNFFALQALAGCYVRMGNMEKAYQMSLKCSQMAQNSKFEAMSTIYHVLICLQANREEEAYRLTRHAAEIAPDYRAAQRTLIGLMGKRGDLAGAHAQANKLLTLEQGFNLDRFFRDPDYPVHTLRRTGLLAQAETRLM